MKIQEEPGAAGVMRREKRSGQEWDRRSGRGGGDTGVDGG
jgi:hypothetical protein